MKIIYSPNFVRNYKKLPEEIKALAEKKEKTFRHNPYNPSLKTHKLHGELRDFWSFSINYKYRIIFEFIDEGNVYLHTVGPHDIY